MKIKDLSVLNDLDFYHLICNGYDAIPLIQECGCFLSSYKGIGSIKKLALALDLGINFCHEWNLEFNVSHVNASIIENILDLTSGFIIKKSRRSKGFHVLLDNYLNVTEDLDDDNCFMCCDCHLIPYARKICKRSI